VKFLTTEEVAEVLHCSTRTVQALIARGEIPSRKLRGMRRVLVPADELEQALAGAELEVVEANGGRIVRVKR
jgi:excisionase family DNA binding protein